MSAVSPADRTVARRDVRQTHGLIPSSIFTPRPSGDERVDRQRPHRFFCTQGRDTFVVANAFGDIVGAAMDFFPTIRGCFRN
jgi:hypothetical protein